MPDTTPSQNTQIDKQKKPKLFDKYQIFIIAIIAIVQFTVVLDFMVLSPLGAQLMRKLDITTAQFGLVVSAYAFSAGASGLLAAGFADRFDRKKLLVFFYLGFILGTLFCGLADTYPLLLAARIITGIFGGVMGSIGFAIITDLFPMEVRGRVMGFVMMSFSVSQIVGIPFSLYLAHDYGWQSPFLFIVAMSMIVVVLVMVKMKPIVKHLEGRVDVHPLKHLFKTVSNPAYIRAFGATALLATGGFLLMPFSSAFLVENVGISEAQLPMIFLVTGIFSMIAGPIIGKLSDRFGKFNLFVGGSILAMIMIVLYTTMGVHALWYVITINVLLFFGITSRMISASALMTAVPELKDRGAFMGVNSSLQQISGGIAATVGGMIVSRAADGRIEHFDTLGWIAVVSMIICAIMMRVIDKYVASKPKTSPAFVAVAEH